MKKPIFVFWHAFLVYDWDVVVSEQFDLLVSSGLYDRCENVICGVVGCRQEIERHGKLLDDKCKKLEIPNKFVIRSSEENNYEYLTIDSIYNFAQDNDAYILYFHTKGISIPPGTNARLLRDDWRRCMEYFCIELWRDCVAKLDEGYRCCGTNYFKRRACFYGNEWWTTTKYAKTLPKPLKKKFGQRRVYYEDWLMQYDTTSMDGVYDFHFAVDIFRERRYPPEKYRKDLKKSPV